MRGLFAISHLSGLSDAVSDLQAQIATATDTLNSANAYLAYLHQQWDASHFGGQNPDQMQGFYNQAQAKIDAANAALTSLKSQLVIAQAVGSNPATLVPSTDPAVQLSNLQAQLAAINKKIDTSGSTDPAVIALNNTLAASASAVNAQISDLQTKINADAAAKAATPAAQAQAARDYVAQQALYTTISTQAQPDYGRGMLKRNAYFGLGGLPMRGLYGLDARVTDSRRKPILERKEQKRKRRFPGMSGLGFDIAAAIEQGATTGIEKYIASSDKGTITGLPSISAPSIPGLPSISLPSWLTSTASVVEKPFASVTSGIMSSVAAAKNAPAPKTAAPGVTAAKPAASSSFMEYAAIAALIIGGGIFVMRRA